MAILNKTEALEIFQSEYASFNDTKRNNFSRLVNKLLKDNFIYVGLDNDKQDYYGILNFRSALEAYLSLIDYNLIHDDNNKVFYIETNIDRNKIRLKKIDTVVLLILRLLYYKGTHEVSLNANNANVLIRTSDLVDCINNTAIFSDEAYKTELLNSLKLLKRYKIVGFTFNKLDDESILAIYPTILQVVKNDNIAQLNNKLEGLKNQRGEVSDTEED